MRSNPQAGSVLASVAGLVVLLLGAGALVGWHAHEREQNRAPARDVVVPAAGTGLCDVHFGWRVAPRAQGGTRRVTLTLTAVPAGSVLEEKGHKLPPDVGPRTPADGVRVTFSIPMQVPASGSTFAGGAATCVAVTDARGVAEADVVVAPDELLVVTGTAEFTGEDGGPRPRSSTFFKPY